MNILIWVLQSLLAVMFLMAGGMKLSKTEDYMKKTGMNNPGLVKFIGTTEVLGALGLILPAVTGILSFLTPTAAVGLAIIMVLATGYHIRRKENGPAVFTLVLLLIAAFVALGRFVIVPLS